MKFLIPVKGPSPVNSLFDIDKSLSDKRFFPRIQCDLKVTYSTDGKGRKEGSIVEISLDGIRMLSVQPLKKREHLTIEACENNPELSNVRYSDKTINTEVVWCRKRRTRLDYISGLQYADEKEKLEGSFIAAMLQKYGIAVGIAQQRRRTIRIEATLPVVVKLKSKLVQGIIKDIGIGGMLIETREKIRPAQVEGYQVGPYSNLKPLYTFGEIAYSRQVPDQKAWEYGVVFVDMNDQRTRHLNSYLAPLLMGK